MSIDKLKGEIPAWKKWIATGVGVTALFSAGCSPEAQGKEPTAEPVHSAAPAKPRVENAENVVQQPVETPAASETASPSASEITTVTAEGMVTAPDGRVVSEEEWTEELDTVLDRFRRLSPGQWNALPESERVIFAKYVTVQSLRMTQLRIENGYTAGQLSTPEYPDLYTHNPLEADAQTDTPEAAFLQYLCGTQIAFMAHRGGTDQSSVQDTMMAMALPHFHSTNDGESWAPAPDEANEETSNSYSMRSAAYISAATAPPEGITLTNTYVIDSKQSTSEDYAHIDEDGKTHILPGRYVVFKQNNREDVEYYVQLVFSNDTWGAIDNGVHSL